MTSEQIKSSCDNAVSAGARFERHRVMFKVLTRLPPTLWVTAETIFAQLFWVLIFTVQALILGPHAFGLIGMVMIFLGFWESVPGVAITDALISIRSIDNLHLSTATTTCALLCLVLGAAVAGLAKPLATALGHAELAALMRAMAVLPLVHAFSLAPIAAAQRELRFRSTAIRTIVSLFAGGVVGVTLTFAGVGVWALVWQAIVQRCVAAVALWFAVPISLSFAISPRHLREVVGFAWPVMLARGMSWVSSQLPRLILGLYLGPTELGLFSLATRLSDIVAQVAILPRWLVARVDLRRFATDPEALRKAVRRVFLQISVLSFPLSVGGAAVIPTLFHTWLDPRWFEATRPSQLMLLTGMPLVTFYVTTAALLALNRQRSEAYIAVAQSVAIVIAVAVAAPFGLAATSAAIGAACLATLPLGVVILRRQSRLALRDILLPQAPAFLAAGAMGIVVSLSRAPLEAAFSSVTALGIMICAGTIFYAVLLAIMTPEPGRVGKQLFHQIIGEVILSLKIRRFLRPFGIERLLYYYHHRMVARSTERCRQSVETAKLLSQIRDMNLVFSVTAGRSGTMFVHKLFANLPNVISEHEAIPSFHSCLRKIQSDPSVAKEFLLKYKLPHIVNLCTPNYVELSHVFCKGFLEPLLEFGITPNLILLRRDPRLIALSYLRRYTIPERTLYGIEFLLSPRCARARALPLPLWRRRTDYQLIFWYVLEIERRQREYSQLVRDRGGVVSDVFASELRSFTCFLELGRAMGLITPTADSGALAHHHAAVASISWNANNAPLWPGNGINLDREEEEVWQLVSASDPQLRSSVEARYRSLDCPFGTIG